MPVSQNGAFREIDGKVFTLKPRDYVVVIPHTGVAGSTAVANINIDPSSIFIMTDRAMSDTNDPTAAAPGLQGQYENSISIQDASNGYNWSNDFVPRSAFARTREHGYRLPDEVVIAANTRLTVSIKEPAAGNLAGSTTVILQGYSIY